MSLLNCAFCPHSPLRFLPIIDTRLRGYALTEKNKYDNETDNEITHETLDNIIIEASNTIRCKRTDRCELHL